MSEFAATVNATEYPPHLKHKVIFETFDGLKSGESMLLVNDHDPQPLRYQFELERGGVFSWEYIERGPYTFQIRIGRIDG
ncbi:DUF2249 domain-containing protein [Alicyclobacillus mengziensis]|uniref:DUF2249 domain-containing protein n=1 Tax=Alicyclobacillus mengziensis TaxID=2931921 RepID=A0A9X7VXZ8_9BACL|nr:DUF2249 domain-containing protein [Alicyclobacillus mengziensis]QSO46665.1 DUF2249 domain-containing protein [Alicyclobacillus mengziensis]